MEILFLAMSPIEIILVVLRVAFVHKKLKSNSRINVLKKTFLSSQILDATSRCLFYILFFVASNINGFYYTISGGPIAFSSLILVLYAAFGKSQVKFIL